MTYNPIITKHMRKIKTFKFNHNQAQDLDYVDGIINDWLDLNDGILIQTSSAYGSNGHLLTRVVYEVPPTAGKKETSLSDYLGINSGVFTVIGVFVALTIFSLSLPQTKWAAYIGAACIGFILLILIDLYHFRRPEGEKAKTLSFFFIYFELLTFYLFIFWIITYRAELKILDGIWAILILGVLYDYLSKKYSKLENFLNVDEYFFLHLTIFFGIFILICIPLMLLITYCLDWLPHLAISK